MQEGKGGDTAWPAGIDDERFSVQITTFSGRRFDGTQTRHAEGDCIVGIVAFKGKMGAVVERD